MSHYRPRLSAALLVFGAVLAAPVLAAPPSVVVPVADDGTMVQQAWALASPGAATNGAVYVTLRGGAQPDSLIDVSTPIAETAAVHETINDSGVMKMRPAPSVAIPPGKSVTFVPGGYHIMLTGLKQQLTVGQSFPLTLTFTHAAPVTVAVQVRGIGREIQAGHDGMHMP